MKYTIAILTLLISMTYSYNGSLNKNIIKHKTLFDLKLHFIEKLENKYSNRELYLADSTVRREMKQALTRWINVDPYISDIGQQNDGFKLLLEDFPAENIDLREILCQDKVICLFNSTQNQVHDSIILISEPQIYDLNGKPTGYVVFNEFETEVIQTRDGDTTILKSKFHIWSAVFDKNMWTSQVKVELF